jgi:hypothetical protein
MLPTHDGEGVRLIRAVSAGALLLSAVLATWIALGNGRAAADQPNCAGLVVTFSDGSTVSRCVEFAEGQISGAELLKRSVLPLVLWGTGAGAAVCKIADEGCDNPNDCFCRCHGSDCRYWAYYTLEEGQWRYSSAGASARKVHDGDVDGWAWGAGKIGEGATPALLTFEEICPPTGPTSAPPLPTEPPPPTTEPPAPPAVEGAADVLAATAEPGAAASPQATAATLTPQSLVLGATPQQSAAERANSEASKKDDDSGLPLQLIAFAGVAAALLATAVVLVRRRAGG